MNDCSQDRRHVVISVRGIRDFGRWQQTLGDAVKQADASIEYVPYDTGWFDVVSFSIPFARQWVVTRFRDWLCDNTRDGDRLDIVAHSFGTFIVARALLKAPPDSPLRVRNLILCGSVLPERFRWGRLLRDRVDRVINECGIRDVPLIASQMFVYGTGMAGKVGFPGGNNDRFCNRYYDFGHGGYFLGGFMERSWVPILAGPERPLEQVDQRPSNPGWRQKLWYTALNFASPAKLIAYASVPLLLVAVFASLYLAKENADLKSALMEEKLQRSRLAVQFSQLADATRLSRSKRNPEYVLDSLYSALGEGESDKAIQHTLSIQRRLRRIEPHRQGSARLRSALDSLSAQLEEVESAGLNDAVYWHTKGLLHSALLHEYQDDTQVPWLKRAFENAASRYDGLAQSTDNHVPRLLAGLDYGTCLASAEELPDASKILSTTLRDAQAIKSVPQWLLGELNREMAECHRKTNRRVALSHLRAALDAVEGEESLKALHAFFLLRLGWFEMDRWDFAAAQSAFSAAAPTLQQVAAYDLNYLHEWLHAQHGQILAGYYADTNSEAAAGRYDDLLERIRRIEGAAKSDVQLLSDRQIRALQGRQANALERRADVFLDPHNPQSAARAAQYYLEAGAYGLARMAANPKDGEWPLYRADMLYRAAAAFAACGELSEARTAWDDAAHLECEAYLPSRITSQSLQRDLSEWMIRVGGAEDQAVVADPATDWTARAIDGFAPKRPHREDIEFTIYCACHFFKHASPDRRRALRESLLELLRSELQITTPESHVVAKPADSDAERPIPIHEKWRAFMQTDAAAG